MGSNGGDSADPSYNPTTIQNNLITGGFTSLATRGPGIGLAVTGMGLYDVGTMLGFSLPSYTAIKGILDAATAYKVELTVQISSTKAAFTAEKQSAFISAVAASANVPRDNVLITVTEKTTSRRTSRKLLATVLDIAITILVKDEKAGKDLIAAGGLTKAKLNEQMELQGLPTITTMVSEAKSALPASASSNSTNTTSDALSAVPAFRPSMALTCVVSLLAIVSASGMLLN